MPKSVKTLEYLLKYPEVSRWITRVMQRTNSQGTKVNYLYNLKYFLGFVGKNPSQLVRMPVEEIEDLMYAYDKSLMDKGLASKTRALAWNTIRSFLKANRVMVNVQFKGRIQVKREDRAPTKEEVRRLLDCLDVRGKVVVALAAFAGLRLDTIAKLKYKAIQKDFEAERIPMKIQVEPEWAKGGIRYYTFLNKLGYEYLKMYLQNRNTIKPEDPLIANKKGEGHLTHSDFISRIIWRGMKKAGLTSHEWTPYDLRKYFKTRLIAGGMKEGWTERLMGHITSLKQIYDVPTEEELRMAYLQASKELDPMTQTLDEETKKAMLLELWREQARAFGIDPMKIRIEKASTEDEIQTLQNEIKKLITQTFKIQTQPNGGNPEHKIIDENQLIDYLNQGWQIVAELKDGRIIIRK